MPTYNVHPSFNVKILVEKVCIILGIYSSLIQVNFHLSKQNMQNNMRNLHMISTGFLIIHKRMNWDPPVFYFVGGVE